jgi:hypothetical protein
MAALSNVQDFATLLHSTIGQLASQHTVGYLRVRNQLAKRMGRKLSEGERALIQGALRALSQVMLIGNDKKRTQCRNQAHQLRAIQHRWSL